MAFPYYSSEVPSYMMEALTFGILIGLFIGLAIAFVFYIFNALGLYQISKKRGYKNAWLAFIPVVNSFVLGGIADNINACYQKKSSYRIWLLILNIVSTFAGGIYAIVAVGNFFQLVQEALIYGAVSSYSGFIAETLLFSSLMSLVSIAMMILNFICQYKLYSDYAPNNATLFLVLSILFSIAPFFIFAIRNKPSASLYYVNQRMNPTPPPYQAPQQPYQAPQQPYQAPQQPYQAPQQPYQAPQQPYQAPQENPAPAADENKDHTTVL